MEVPRRVSAGARTNVPSWPHDPPPFDPAATASVVVLVDAPLPRGWPGDDVRRCGPGDELASLAQDLAATSRVGVRVGVAGPEADVLLLRAHLLAAGFVEDELVLHASSADEIRLRCAHCGGVHRVRARPGGTGSCPACGYELDIHPHFSPRHAAYLGVRSDAELPQ